MTSPAPRTWFAFLCGLASLVAWRPLHAAFSLALHNDGYTQILLILPVAIVLIGVEWPSADLSSSSGRRAGLLLLAASLLTIGLEKWKAGSLGADVRLSLQMAALVTWWIGAFVLCFGARASRSLMFPLGFLFWLVPFPLSWLDWIVAALQQSSAEGTHLLFSAFRVPVTQDGVLLTIPGLTIEVAQECSSIRSSLMLLVTTMVLAHVFLRSPWRKFLIVAAAVPLAIAKNALRIFTISMLATRVDPGYLNGKLHHQGGVLFFAIALAFLSVLLWLLQQGERRSTPASPAPIAVP
jgi:exosortase